MHPPDPLLFAALLTLAGAAALTAHQPSAPAVRSRRFPAAVTALAAVNIALTIIAVATGESLPGIVLLGSAFLLLYAGHRRARHTRPSRPPQPPRQPPR